MTIDILEDDGHVCSRNVDLSTFISTAWESVVSFQKVAESMLCISLQYS